MKNSILFIFLLGFLWSSAQEQTIENKTYIKANAVFLPLGILNAGIETQLSPRYTFQADLLVSPWKSFDGKYAQALMLGFDARYYFNKAFSHWYIGLNFSTAVYKLQKWEYWKEVPYQLHDDTPIFTASNLYQTGFSFMMGATVGYQFQLNEHWNLDLYIGGGNSQDFYRGYDKTTGARYDDPYLNRTWNRSGEWLPYRGGVMFSYRIK